MTTDQITPLDEKLLLGWHCGPDAGERPTAGTNSTRGDAAHRPGYGFFRLLLVFSLFFGVLAMSPWSPLRVTPALSMEAGGYMYLSVPLNATEPQFEQTALRLDVMGAGLHVNVLEMEQSTGKTRFLTRKNPPRNWRLKRRALQYESGSAGHKLLKQAPRRKKAHRRASPAQSAKAQYLALLRAYERERSSTQKRMLYPQLLAAYNRAQTKR